MERLRQKDAESGVTVRTLTDAEKAQIAEIRSVYEARLAEAQVMHESRIRNVADPSAREALDGELCAERERLVNERERKIEKVRAG